MMRVFAAALFVLAVSAISVSTSWAEEQPAAEPAQSATQEQVPVMLDDAWMAKAKDVWNSDKDLSKGLFDSGWAANSKNNRGYRIIEFYRTDCPNAPRVQMRIEAKDGMAVCTVAGNATDKDYDFLMWADTKDWTDMGAGKYGPSWAMFTGKLSFKGSMIEAMQNMGPFKSFLLMFGKIPTATNACN